MDSIAKVMKLNYSFRDIQPLWFDGDLPFPEMRTERVKVRLSGHSSSDFPAFFEMGDLLTYSRPTPKQSAITLLLQYQAGTVPLTNEPPELNVWYDEPGSPIFGQIRVALPPEAVRQIRKVPGKGYNYEIHIENAELFDVTPKRSVDNQ